MEDLSASWSVLKVCYQREDHGMVGHSTADINRWKRTSAYSLVVFIGLSFRVSTTFEIQAQLDRDLKH